MALLRNFLIFGQLLSLMRTQNVQFFPCDSDKNTTKVDCSDRPLKNVPAIRSNTVVSLNLSRTKIRYIGEEAFAGVQNLQTLTIMGNCRPDEAKTLNTGTCKMEIHKDAFRGLRNLTALYLSRNSLTSIPWLPETLTRLDLQYNCIFQINNPLETPHLETLLLTGNCFYANPCNQAFYINQTVFRELPYLKNLTLGYNNLTSVPDELPPSLESLDLRENTITEVLDKAFANLTKLQTLILEWNCQRCDHAARPCISCPNKLPLHLHSNSFFAENSAITFLDLRGNSLRTFPEGMFRPLKNLKHLDLSDNYLAYAMQNGSFFADLKGLTWISLIYNYEPLVTFGELSLSPYFGTMSALQYLLLSGNFFHKLSDQSLIVLSQLKNLNLLELRMNFIDNCNVTALKQLPSLFKIDLSQNMLSFLPCATSTQVYNHEPQKTLHNQTLYTHSLNDQPVIVRNRHVPSGNEISDQSSEPETQKECKSPFPTLTDIKIQTCNRKLTIDLSQNNIMSLNNHVLQGIENVVCLDLSLNYMNQAVRGGYFNSTKHLVFLNLSYNRLDLYYTDALKELRTTLKVLDISNNDFHFNMKGMGHRFAFLQTQSKLEFLSLANNGIGMRIDEVLVSSSIKYLYFNGNHLNIMWESNNSKKYSSFFQNLTSLVFLDISNNYLTLITEDILSKFPTSIQNLIISDNQLTFFPWEKIGALSSLVHLDLSQNKLCCFPKTMIQFGVNLSSLDLSHNDITYIPKDFLSEANSLQCLYLSHNLIKELDRRSSPSPLPLGSSLKKLTLHHNPFKCDCGTSWFVDFLRTTQVQIPHLTTGVSCGFPESKQGQSILSMDRHSCQDIYGSLAFLVCSFLTVMFTVLPLLKHLYGWDLWYCLQVLWAGHKGYSQLAGSNSPQHFDAFVVFNTKNQAVRDWVYNELTVNLETGGHRRFCLCLEERDWIPGNSCIDNLHSAVHNSVKTVFVLSSAETVTGYIREAFYMVQQRLLDEKVDAAVLVLLDEMFPKLKYLQLRKRLCGKSVLTWPKNPKAQPLFWNQMRMVLSSDNLKLYDNNMTESFI